MLAVDRSEAQTVDQVLDRVGRGEAVTTQPAADHGTRPAEAAPAVHVHRPTLSEAPVDGVEDVDHVIDGWYVEVPDRQTDDVGPTDHVLVVPVQPVTATG